MCETSDFFLRDARLPRPEEGDLLAIRDAGAYGFAMSSNYNFRGTAGRGPASRTEDPGRPPPRRLSRISSGWSGVKSSDVVAGSR